MYPKKALSMDSTSGWELIQFDRSLMGRLSDGGMRMSQINVQQGMQPSISHFVRYEVSSHRQIESRPYIFAQEDFIPQVGG